MNLSIIENLIVRQWKWLLVLILALGLTVAAAVYFELQKQVTIQVDGQKLRLATFETSVRDLLNQQNVILAEKDGVSVALEAPTADGQRITVTRAFPVMVVADGDTTELQTLPLTAGEALAEAGVKLGSMDKIQPSADVVLAPWDRVVVTRVTVKDITKDIEIPYHMVMKDENTLEKGIRKVLQRGKAGLEREQVRITYEDGREVGREVVSRTRVKEPVDQVIATGTIRVASRGGHTFQFREMRMMEATAYTHTGNLTFTDVYPHVGTVAVDPRVIPLGTRLYVEGYGYGVAQDTGGAIKGDRIDVFLETNKEANRWGRKQIKVYILE